MREIALHLLDIAENSIAAGARNIEITIDEDVQNDRLKAKVQDDGRGMDDGLLAQVIDPFVTSRTTRKVGLGIPLFKAAAEACEGSLCITSEPGRGTCLEVDFRRSHIDRMPLGDVAGTFLTLIVGYPEVHWVFRYRADSAEFIFDDEPIKKELEGIPLTEPSILTFLRETLQEGVGEVQRVVVEIESMRQSYARSQQEVA